MKEYKFQIYEVRKDKKDLLVVEGSSKNKENAERELNHYAFMYIQDGAIKIKKSWK